MKVNLFINFYQDKNESRQRELLICVLSNIYNSEIDLVTILVSNKDVDDLMEFLEKVKDPYKEKINVVPFEKKPTYNDYFKFTESFPDDINIISNKDIIIGVSSLSKIKKLSWKNYCIALSRWDFVNNQLVKEEAVHFNRPDSQDTWIVKGAFPQLKGVTFGLGEAGCDNAIAERLSHHYEVINPSLEIKTYHYHITSVRNYLTKNQLPSHMVEKPYKLLTPIMLPR